MSDLGFEIGSRSMTHRYLTDLSDGDLRQRELEQSKQTLEQMVRKPVEHFSFPGRALEFANGSGGRAGRISHPGLEHPACELVFD